MSVRTGNLHRLPHVGTTFPPARRAFESMSRHAATRNRYHRVHLALDAGSPDSALLGIRSADSREAVNQVLMHRKNMPNTCLS